MSQNLADQIDQPATAAPQPARRADMPTQKQKTNVYTVMLIISFICIVTACILLYWELTLWGSYPWWNVNEGKPAISQQAPASALFPKLLA